MDEQQGFTLARWYEGVLGEEKITTVYSDQGFNPMGLWFKLQLAVQ